MLEHRPLDVERRARLPDLEPHPPPRSAVPPIIGRLLTLARTWIFPFVVSAARTGRSGRLVHLHVAGEHNVTRRQAHTEGGNITHRTGAV